MYGKVRKKYMRDSDDDDDDDDDDDNVRLIAFILCSGSFIDKSLQRKERSVKLRTLEHSGLHVAQNPSVCLGCFRAQ